METRATFEPSPGGVEVSFVRGVDRFSKSPDFVKRAGLNVRLAVVQQTYVKGCLDMYFDEPLWRALAEFIQSKAHGGMPQVTTEGGRSLPLDRFLQDWETTAAEEREPPAVMTAKSNARPILCMVTDYWTRVGGPALYHDSYTYSLYSDGDIGAEVLAALAKAPARARWTMMPEIIPVHWTPPPSLAYRLRAWVTGKAAED